MMIILMTWSQSCQAAVAYVQSAVSTLSTGSSTTKTVAFSTQNVTTGNLIAVYVTWASTSGSISSVSDNCSAGNTYTVVSGTLVNDASDLSGEMAYAPNVTGGSECTVTVTFSTSETDRTVAVEEISGVSTSSPIDASTGAQGIFTSGTNSWTTGNWTTNTNGDFIFGGVNNPNQNGIASVTAGTSSLTYTLRQSLTTNSWMFAIEDGVQTTASASTVTAFTPNSGGTFIISAIAFKPVPPPTTTSSIIQGNSTIAGNSTIY